MEIVLTKCDWCPNMVEIRYGIVGDPTPRGMIGLDKIEINVPFNSKIEAKMYSFEKGYIKLYTGKENKK